VDDGDAVFLAQPPRSSSAAGQPSPPWFAFGIATVSLVGIAAAFVFFSKHRGKHRRPRWMHEGYADHIDY
jgi:hypothetical protein